MPSVAKSARHYDSSRRKAQAQENRARMLQAARELFVELGYSSTTLAMIAERANVALPTLYAGFGAKRGLLAALIEGDTDEADSALNSVDASFVDQVSGIADPVERVRQFAKLVCSSFAGSTDLLVALRTAATSEAQAGDLDQRLRDARYDAVRLLVNGLAADDALRAGLSSRAASDTLWALTDVQTYLLLVTDRGWTKARYERWLADLLISALLISPGSVPAPVRSARR